MAKDNFSDAFGDLNAALASAGDAVLVLPLRAVAEDPNNPRSSFDEAELKALAQTIRQRGVLQPIVVRPPGSDGRHVIRFGARRFRAAQLAGLSEIRAIVQPGDSDEADALIEQLVENEQREGLTTAELAAAVERLQTFKLSQSEIARRLGRPREQVAMLAAVRDMPKELKALAPKLGVRTLFELHQAWKADPGRTRAWLSGREPRTMTQAAARELAGRPTPTRQVIRDPSDGSVRDTDASAAASRSRTTTKAAQGPATDSPATLGSSTTPGATAVFEVKARGVRGELVLDNVLAPRSDVLVRLEDGTLRPVSVADLRIVKVRPG